MTVFALMAPFAGHIGEIVFEQYAVAFLDALALLELAARLGDDADVLVTHDHVFDLLGVVLDVAAADARDFDLDEGRFRVDVGHIEFTVNGFVRAHLHGRRDFLHHCHFLQLCLWGLGYRRDP